MFVRYYLELPLPPARVEQALLGSPWLSELAGEAQRRGDVLTVKDFLDRVGRAIALSAPAGPATMGP